MNLKRSLLVSLTALWSMTGLAETRSLNLDQCLQLAMDNSEALRIASLQIEQAADEVAEVSAGAKPQVSTSLNYSRFFETPVLPTPMGDFPIKRDWDLTFEARVTQVLWAFGRVTNAIEAARIFQNLRELNQEQAKNEVISQVKSLYFSALHAEKTLAITRESYENAKRNQQSLRRRFASGRIPQFDNLKMETDIALRLPQVIKAEQDLAQFTSTLKFLIGLDQATPIKIVGDWPKREELTANSELFNKALQNNLNLKALSTQKNLLSKQTQNERASRYPTIAGFAYYQKAGTGNDFYIGGSNLYDTAAVGVQVNYDIWTGGSRASRLAKSLKDERVVEENISQLQRNISSEIATIVANLQSLERNLEASRRAQALAKEAYSLTRTRYESGLATQTELNDAEMNQTNAQLTMEMILFGRQMEWIKLEKLLAGT